VPISVQCSEDLRLFTHYQNTRAGQFAIMPKKYQSLSVEEAAAQLKVLKWLIYRAIAARKLNAYKIGQKYRITQEDLNAFVASQRTDKRAPVTLIAVEVSE
jgi:excisionase family DNA binding protein